MKIIKYKNIILLGLILVVGIILRFYSLGMIPSSLNWDEVSWGYNAYSIAQSGRDEYGKLIPLSFEAFGDFKQPVYIYLDSILVKIFGLNAYSVRGLSAIFGSISILFVFLLVKELFIKREERYKLALLSALFFAISPWSIQFSRVAYEANLGVFFIILSTYLYIKGLNSKKTWLMIASLIPFTIAGFTYHSLKIFTPLFFSFLLIYSFKKISKKWILVTLFVIYLLLNSIWILDLRTTSRGRSVTFFLHPEKVLEVSINERARDVQSNDLLAPIVHNSRLVFVNKFSENYLSHFNPTYLFVKGDNPRHHAPGMGLLYLISLPFIILGMYYFARNKIKESLIIFVWMILAPIASSLAIDAPNASRSLIFLPTWDIFFAAGIVIAEASIKRKYLLYFRILFWGLLIFNFVYFVHQYFVHTNQETQYEWQYGYREAAEFAGSQNKNQKVFFDPNVEQGYIFYLFYNNVSPSSYLSEGGSSRIKNNCYAIGNAYFGSCKQMIGPGDIYINTDQVKELGNFPLTKIKSINNINNSPAINIYKVEL